MKILIVDDSYEIRDVLRRFIEKHGHEVIEAVDGQDGFVKAKTHKPDLIVTDAMMPNVDGFTLLRNIKMDPNLSSIPCVFYSAIYTDSRDRELALSLGAEAFIEKPKKPDEFWEKIQTILERKKLPSAQIEKRMVEDEKEFLKCHSQTVVAKLEEKVKDLEKVIAENKQMEKSLHSITVGISSFTGKAFFRSLVQHIAKALDIDYVFIGKLTRDSKEVKTVAVYAHGSIVDNFIYKLAGTPCTNVINNRVCTYTKGVQKQFPGDRTLVEMGVESYVGIPLFDSNGNPLGLLTAMSCKELDNPQQLESLLLIFAARASAELERNLVEDSLQKSEASLANAQRIARLGNWEWNIVTNELRWSDEIYRIFGLSPQEFGATYEAFLNSVHPDDREFVKKSVNNALYEKMPYSIDHRIVLPNGTERIVHEQAEVVFDNTGKAIQMKGTVQDVTERKRAEEEIRRLFTAIDQSINVVFITNVKGHIEYVNSMLEHITGYTKEDVIGRNPSMFASGETTHAEYEELWNTILAGKTWRGIFKNKKKDGQYYWGNGLITPIRNEKGQITHFLAVQEDITEKMQTEEKVKYLASHDELTGILNRTCFMERLNEWLSHNKDYIQTGVLLLIDIDGFRLINDTYGHSTGDNVLRHVAVFLTATLFEIDKHYVNKDVRESILGRLGGDEFAIFLLYRDEKKGMETAEEIRKRLEKSRFVEVPGHVTTSIGVAIYPRDGSTAKELITRADASIYHAKELGHNRIHLYNTEDLVLEKIRSRMEWKGRIQKAIDEDRFVPWFQPVLVLKNNQVHHYEALARMRDTNGEVILPWSFVDTAETFGLITAIDRIIINKTLKTQSNLCKQDKVSSFSMNLSGKDLGDKEFLQFLKSAIIEADANPALLIFEITETAAIRDLDRAIKFIRELKAIGCSFALDDFGVGFTSFKYLREMEVDYIKIDGVFIRMLHETTNDHIFVKAIADVARSMGIKTIAEFVENNEIIIILREYGVDYGQGYFIGKPSPEM